jgi:hypothetical protein
MYVIDAFELMDVKKMFWFFILYISIKVSNKD